VKKKLSEWLRARPGRPERRAEEISHTIHSMMHATS
jgi:hypothetical protein